MSESSEVTTSEAIATEPSSADTTPPTFSGDLGGLSQAADELSANRAKAAADAETATAVQGGDGNASPIDHDGSEPPAGSEVADVDARASEAAASDAAAAQLKQALAHPQVQQAISDQFSKAEAARQSYANALNVVGTVLQETLFAQFPDLKSKTPEQFQAALEKLAEQDPAKYASARALTDRLASVQAAQRLEQQQRQGALRRAFADYAKAEDARFDAMLKGEKPETVQKVAGEIIAYAEELGVPRDQFLQLCRTEPVMRNAAFQKMMYDAASWRLLQQAKDEVTRKVVPPVQRPGVSVDSKVDAKEGELRALNARFANNPSIRAAADVLMAQRRSRGR